MPDRNGAMTMAEIIAAWEIDRKHIKELEAQLLHVQTKILALEAIDNRSCVLLELGEWDDLVHWAEQNV